jgi:multidrug efflux system membrane fusion protein
MMNVLSPRALRRDTLTSGGTRCFPIFSIFSLMLAVALVASLTACSNSKAAQNNQGAGAGGRGGRGGADPNRPIPVGVAPVESRDIPIILTGLGSIAAFNTVTVRSRVDGQLVKVNFREGQNVREGELLAVIDPRPYQVALQQAEAALARDQAQFNTSKVNLGRAESLVKEGIYAQQQLDQQRAETGQFSGAMGVDQAQVENARLNLSYTNIKAPVTGRVGLRLVDVGNMVHASDATGMLVITQVQPIAVLFTLPEDNLPAVVERMRKGTLKVDAYSRDDQNLVATGRLETVDNQIDPTTGTVRLKAIFDNKDQVLWPNQFVNVHLELETRKNAVVAPASAIQRGQQGMFVFAVDQNNTAQMRNVQVALTQGTTSLIASGLQPGDRVVTDGQERLQNNAKVDPRTPQAQQQASADSGQGEQVPGGRRRPQGGTQGAAGASGQGSQPGQQSQPEQNQSGKQGQSMNPMNPGPNGQQPGRGPGQGRRQHQGQGQASQKLPQGGAQ